MTQAKPTPNPSEVLGTALARAGAYLGLTQTELAQMIGKDRSAVSRGLIDPNSKAGELALTVVRCYRSLHALFGGNKEHMKHWVHVTNLHLNGVPAELMKSIVGLVQVASYLDSMRGKV